MEWFHQLCSLEHGWRDVKLKAQRLVRRLLSSDKGPVRGGLGTTQGLLRPSRAGGRGQGPGLRGTVSISCQAQL